MRTGQPAVIADVARDPNFQRSKAASDVGIRSAVAFPVLVGKESVAVLEFFSERIIHLDHALFEVMASIGGQLGRVVERKRAEEQLREKERLAAMGSTAAVFAHEVANPLSGISTTIQLLRKQLTKQNDPMINSSLDDLGVELHRLQALLNDFRSLSRPKKLNIQPADLAQITKEVLTTGVAIPEQPVIKVVEEFDPELPVIMADGEKLKQVLLNLCKNAIEAMPKGGTMTVRGKRSGNRVMLEIEDTGVGIAPGIDIFDLFTTTKREGTGLGLAIVRQIMSAHAGRIAYTSEPGKGTIFRLIFPLAAAHP